MDLSISLDAKEVLFHLNYMGYRNVSKEQLKYFMKDLKKLIKFESSPRESAEVHIQAGPSSINIRRLFETHTITSKTKQKEKPKDDPKALKSHTRQAARPRTPCHEPQTSRHAAQPQASSHPCHKPATRQETVAAIKDKETEQKPTRVTSAESSRRPSVTFQPPKTKTATVDKKTNKPKSEQANKENIPNDPPPFPKSKMWIRPRSGSAQGSRMHCIKNDPVSLYQAYQKDWEKFKPNICESSHSDLRWSIRERMMSNR